MTGAGDHNRKGRWAEDRAASLLEGRGYRVVERNFRGTRGELDIVAWHGDMLVFVEVRARTSDGYGEAVETVGASKRGALVRTAREFLRARDLEDAPVRFDVVTFSGEGLRRVRVLQGAFEVSDPWV